MSTSPSNSNTSVISSADLREKSVSAALAAYESALVAYALTLTRDPDRAREAVRATFLRLCRRNPARFARNGASGDGMQPWLFSTCRKLAKPSRREAASDQPVEVRWKRIAGPAGNEGAPTDPQLPPILRQLAGLPANQQEALVLKCQQGLRYREIAAITGLSTGNIAFLIHSGLKRLRGL